MQELILWKRLRFQETKINGLSAICKQAVFYIIGDDGMIL